MVRGRALVALAIATACTADIIVRGADPDLSLLQTRVDRLDALTQRVEALSTIKRLQRAYGHYSELGLWHDFADLFADSGVGYYTQGALDREEIRSLMAMLGGYRRTASWSRRIYENQYVRENGVWKMKQVRYV